MKWLLKNEKFLITGFIILAVCALAVFIRLKMPVIPKDPEVNIEDVVTIFDNGQKEQAISILEELLAKEPENENYQNLLSSYYFQTKQNEKFISMAEDYNLDSAQTYGMLANIYEQKGDSDMALKYYLLALNSNPKNSSNYIALSAHYQSKGDLNKAIEIIERGLANIPKSVNLNLRAASISLKMNNDKLAGDYAKKVLEFDPNNSQARAILAGIK